MSSVVFAVPPCPACGGSWCLEIRVVLIPSLFGIHIFPWYHKRSSFHWHSPNAIPFLSFWSWCLEIRVVLIPSLFGIHIFPWYHKRSSFHWHSPSAIPFLSFSFASKFFLMAWISVSFLLAPWILPRSLSWNSASSSASILISSFSGKSQHSLGSRIPTFLVSLLSPAVGRSPARLVRASGFPPSFPGRYTILKLYWVRNLIHLPCRSLNSLDDMKVTRFLWSV